MARRRRATTAGLLPLPPARAAGRRASCSPGTEVKSLRGGKAQLKDGYAAVRDGEVWLHNVHIPPYAPATRENHEPERDRKLLMHRREIDRLIGKTREKGLTHRPHAALLPGPTPRSRSRWPAARTSATSARRSRSASRSARWSGRSAAAEPAGGRRSRRDAKASRSKSPPVQRSRAPGTIRAAGLSLRWPRSLRLVLRVWNRPYARAPGRASGRCGPMPHSPGNCEKRGSARSGARRAPRWFRDGLGVAARLDRTMDPSQTRWLPPMAPQPRHGPAGRAGAARRGPGCAALPRAAAAGRRAALQVGQGGAAAAAEG